MLTPRFFAAALLVAALLPHPPVAWSAPDADPDKTPSPAAKAKASPSHAKSTTASPSPSPKASPKPSPKHSQKAAPKASPKSASKSASQGDSPKASPKSVPKTSSKKTKKPNAKPKPAVRKRSAPQEEPRAHQEEPTPVKKTEEEPVQKPMPEPAPAHHTAAPTPARNNITAPARDGSVVVSKSGVAEEEEPAPAAEPEKTSWWWPFGHPRHYKYLSRSVREAIDDAPVPRHQWRYIVVHNSGTRQGNAKAFDFYHRTVRKMPNGLAYHFVIGNGTSSGNGAVEIGSRWTRQINGGHVHSDYLNSIALGICLVGDYNRDRPTKEQLEALDELIQYLRKRVGKTDHKFAVVKPHRDINPPQWPTDCPGDLFPYGWLHTKFEE